MLFDRSELAEVCGVSGSNRAESVHKAGFTHTHKAHTLPRPSLSGRLRAARGIWPARVKFVEGFDAISVMSAPTHLFICLRAATLFKLFGFFSFPSLRRDDLCALLNSRGKPQMEENQEPSRLKWLISGDKTAIRSGLDLHLSLSLSLIEHTEFRASVRACWSCLPLKATVSNWFPLREMQAELRLLI